MKNYIPSEKDFLREEDMTILRRSSKAIKTSHPLVWENFIRNAKLGLASCASYLISHLSYDEPVIRLLGAIDPCVQQTTAAKSVLQELVEYIPVNFTEEEKDEYDADIDRLWMLPKLPPIVDKDGKPAKPDIFFAKLFAENNLPKLEKVITTALALFVGPIVEGIFSTIQNIVTDKRNRLQDHTVSAILTVRDGVKADGRPLESIFAVGPDAKVDHALVTAIRSSYKRTPANVTYEVDVEPEIDYGVKPVTKRKALEELREDVKRVHY